jgi:hypothetical protein
MRIMRELRVTDGARRLYTCATAGPVEEIMALSKMTLLLAAVLLWSCSPGRAPAPSPATPAPQKNVFDPLTRDLDRARGAQTSVDQNSAATRDAIDAAERGESAPR